MADQASHARPDFFVSYTAADQAWAEWIAYTLEAKGFTCVIQAWDIRPGTNFVLEMHRAIGRAERTVAVLSPAYLQKPFPASEWAAALANDPEGMSRKLVPVRVEGCQPEGLLRSLVHIDLVGLDEAAAAATLLGGVAPGRAKPATSPAFPGARAEEAMTAPAPAFPGHRTSDSPRREPQVLGGAMPARNANFTGRAALLEAMHASLAGAAEGPTALTQAAVHGLGGVGKTSLAREYVHRFGPEHAGVWWLAAETREGIITGLAALAARLDPALAGVELEKAAPAALARVEASNQPFLLVYDNVPTPGVLEGLVPARGARVLLTTRWSDWGGRAREVLVETLEEDEATELLQARAGRRDQAGARRLARDLGDLPLALDHAGAYVRLAVMNFDAYAKRVEELIAKPPKGAPYPTSVGATFGLAIEAAAEKCAAAERLLSFFAFLAPERIPLDLVDEAVLLEDERDEALMALTAVSLVRPDPAMVEGEAPSVSVHRLVQAVTRTRLAAKDAADAMLRTVMSRLAEAFPREAYNNVRSWPACERLLPHVTALRSATIQAQASAEAARLFDAAGGYLHRRGVFREAELLYQQAIEVGTFVLGRHDAMVARALNNLAHLYRDVDRFSEAEPLYKEAISIGGKALGDNAAEVATWTNNLGNLYRVTKRYADAEKLIRRAICLGEAACGRRDERVAVFIANFASLHRDTGRPEEAEALYREAISIGEDILGRRHPNVATWLNAFGDLYRGMGRRTEAAALYAEAVDIGGAALGSDNPDVALWAANLAATQGDE